MDEGREQLDDELLSAYLDGELDAAERARVEARLDADPAARALLAELSEMSASLRAMPRHIVGRDLRPEVWQAVDGSDPHDAREADDEPATISLSAARAAREDRTPRRMAWVAAMIAAGLLLMLITDERAERQRDERDLAARKSVEDRETSAPRIEAPTISAAPDEGGDRADGATERFAASGVAGPASAEPRGADAAADLAEQSGLLVEERLERATPPAAPASPAASPAGADFAGGGYGGGGFGRGVRAQDEAPAPETATAATSDAEASDLPSAEETIELRLAQPRALVRFQEVLMANSIQFEEAPVDVDKESSTPSSQTLALESSAPHSSPNRAETLAAAAQQATPDADADAAAQSPDDALAEMAEEAAGTRSEGARLGRAAMLGVGDGEQVSAVLVEATPRQLAAVLDAVRSDSLNFAGATGRPVAELSRAPLSGEVKQVSPAVEEPLAVGRAMQFNVPRSIAVAGHAKLEETVEQVIEQDRAGRQFFNQQLDNDSWKLRAINTPADAEQQIRVLFLLDAEPTGTP